MFRFYEIDFLNDQLVQVILNLFNKILDTGVTPERWANIIVIMPYKKELISTSDNYRMSESHWLMLF